MKLVWCPETAFKSYIDAVRSLTGLDLEDANVAELLGALAGGWKAQLIVEARARGDTPSTSLGLAAAAKHTRGRRVVVITEDRSASEYSGEAEVVVGEAEEVMREVEGVDFMVVDFRRRDARRVMREARAGPRGMVVVCKNINVEMRKGSIVFGNGMRVVRSAYLPIARGVEILHVGVGKEPRICGSGGGCSRWFKHVDRVTGEEHLFRK